MGISFVIAWTQSAVVLEVGLGGHRSARAQRSVLCFARAKRKEGCAVLTPGQKLMCGPFVNHDSLEELAHIWALSKGCPKCL